MALVLQAEKHPQDLEPGDWIWHKLDECWREVAENIPDAMSTRKGPLHRVAFQGVHAHPLYLPGDRLIPVAREYPD